MGWRSKAKDSELMCLKEQVRQQGILIYKLQGILYTTVNHVDKQDFERHGDPRRCLMDELILKGYME